VARGVEGRGAASYDDGGACVLVNDAEGLSMSWWCHQPPAAETDGERQRDHWERSLRRPWLLLLRLGFVVVEVQLVDVPVVVIARAAAARDAPTPTSPSSLPRRRLLQECRSNRRGNLRVVTCTLLISSSQQQFVDLESDSVATGRCQESQHGRSR
jgi:hypothetical protein